MSILTNHKVRNEEFYVGNNRRYKHNYSVRLIDNKFEGLYSMYDSNKLCLQEYHINNLLDGEKIDKRFEIIIKSYHNGQIS